MEGGENQHYFSLDYQSQAVRLRLGTGRNAQGLFKPSRTLRDDALSNCPASLATLAIDYLQLHS